jgi:hypothetical protein
MNISKKEQRNKEETERRNYKNFKPVGCVKHSRTSQAVACIASNPTVPLTMLLGFHNFIDACANEKKTDGYNRRRRCSHGTSVAAMWSVADMYSKQRVAK